MALAEQELEQDEELLALLALLFSVTNGVFPKGNQAKRMVLDRLTLRAKLQMRQLGSQLAEGAITLQMFEAGMIELINQAHTGAGVLAVGGLADYDIDIRQVVEENKRTEYEYLAGFIVAIVAGQVLAGKIPQRAGQYSGAARATYYDIGTQEAVTTGFDLEENILNPADHCEGGGSCIEQTNRGVVPIGTLIPIGGRVCLSNCQCNIRQINSVTGEVRVI